MQGKNREFAAVGVLRRGKEVGNAKFCLSISSKFPTRRNREFLGHEQGIRSVSREFRGFLKLALARAANVMQLVSYAVSGNTSPSAVGGIAILVIGEDSPNLQEEVASRSNGIS